MIFIKLNIFPNIFNSKLRGDILSTEISKKAIY